MRYDVVIPTLNRVESLAACLTHLEAQSELPARVIVVDAGDEPGRTQAVLERRNPSIDWQYVRSERRNLPFQRNLGIRRVVSEVVVLPDDDSMLYPGAAAELMAAYRADRGGRVAAVAGAPMNDPAAPGAVRQMTRARDLKERVAPLRRAFESRFVPAPYETYPRSLWQSRQVPAWVDGSRFALVETIMGCRLSLRADLAKEHPFDEVLGYRIGYALAEDLDMCLRLQRLGYLLVGASRAGVFHDAHPGKRAGGFDYGFCWIANYLYACRRSIPDDSVFWTVELPRFMAYKLALYRTRSMITRSTYHKEAYQGAAVAWGQRNSLMAADRAGLAAAYRALCDAHALPVTSLSTGFRPGEE